MFALKRKKAESEKVEQEQRCPEAEAEELHQRTLSELNRGLVVKREVREKTARFVGTLRPMAKAR